MTERETVRTRFAPSPSGHLHVGGARTALFCWAFARQHGGTFILRIEDTDRKRSSDAASLGFLQDLKWLGIEWDEGPEFDGCGGGEFGPYFSSERLDIYKKYADKLIDADLAYRAFETPEEIQAMRDKAVAESRNPLYQRPDLSPEEQRQYLNEGQKFVIRFKVPGPPDSNELIKFDDKVRGKGAIARNQLDDFVIMKSDGFPTYHFAVVVDDELMGVTHVIRGMEHLSNTFKHVLLQKALGFRRPVYAHLSLISNPDGSKMSKRDKDKALRIAVREQGIESPSTAPGGSEPAVSEEHWNWWQSSKDHQLELDAAERLARAIGISLPEVNVDDYRRSGYLPDVLVNYLALLGWSPGKDIEKFGLEFLKNNFSFDRIIKAPAKFDRDKLLAFNHDAIQAMDADTFARLFVEHVRMYHQEFPEALTDEQLMMLGRANHPRSKTLDDQIESSRFFIMDDHAIEYDPSEKAIRKALLNGEPSGCEHLEALLPPLRDWNDWTVESLEHCVREFTDAHAEGKLGKVAQPLRIAVSGGAISPAIFDTLVILGKQSTINRIEHCLKSMSANSRSE